MVRDILIDINEKDLLFTNKRPDSDVHCDVVWGKIMDSDPDDVLYCNVLVPPMMWSKVSFAEEDNITILFHSPYKATEGEFYIRLIKFQVGKYELFEGMAPRKALSYALERTKTSEIYPCQLPLLDMDGNYLVLFKKGKDECVMYSSKQTDLAIGFSDDQTAQLLTICAPGNNYRYPTTGVDIYSYINSVISHTDLQQRIQDEFKDDKRSINEMDFDSITGAFNISFSHEVEVEDDIQLITPELLDKSILTDYTDDFIMENVHIPEIDDREYYSLLNAAGIKFTDDGELMLLTYPDSMVDGGFIDDDGLLKLNFKDI